MPGIPPIQPYPMPKDMPANTARWSVDPDRAVLLIHDMQRFFLRPFDSAPALRDELVANAVSLLSAARDARVPVAYTAQPGDMTVEQRGLLRDFWGPGMRVALEDREIVARLRPEPDDWLLTKWRYSAFFRSDLLERMRADGRDQLVICGVYAHVGVLMTAVDAFTQDIQPFLVGDAVADFAESEHRFTLRYAADRCAVVATTSSVLSGLLSRVDFAPREAVR